MVIRDIAAVFCISSKHYRLLYFFCTKTLDMRFRLWYHDNVRWSITHMYLLLVSIVPRHFANNLLLVSASWLLAFFHTVPIFGDNELLVLGLEHWFCLGIWIPLFREWCFCLFFVFLFKHALIQLTFFGNGGSYD